MNEQWQKTIETPKDQSIGEIHNMLSNNRLTHKERMQIRELIKKIHEKKIEMSDESKNNLNELKEFLKNAKWWNDFEKFKKEINTEMELILNTPKIENNIETTNWKKDYTEESEWDISDLSNIWESWKWIWLSNTDKQVNNNPREDIIKGIEKIKEEALQLKEKITSINAEIEDFNQNYEENEWYNKLKWELSRLEARLTRIKMVDLPYEITKLRELNKKEIKETSLEPSNNKREKIIDEIQETRNKILNIEKEINIKTEEANLEEYEHESNEWDNKSINKIISRLEGRLRVLEMTELPYHLEELEKLDEAEINSFLLNV